MVGPFKTIRVLGKRYRINWDATIESKDWGEIDQNKGCINISTIESPDELRETLLHEAIHALAPFVPEAHVREISAGMFAVLRDNKTLAKWILEESAED